ncbi:hypothetical protein MY4038_005154 [Beauveria bassiana]
MDLADSLDSQVTSDQLNSHPSHDLLDAAAYTDSDNRPVAGHSSFTDSSVRLASHQIQNSANPYSCCISRMGDLPSAGERTAQTSGVIDGASASGLLDDVSSQFDGLVPPPPTYQPEEDTAYLLSEDDEAIPMTTMGRNAIGHITDRVSSALRRVNNECDHIRTNTD